MTETRRKAPNELEHIEAEIALALVQGLHRELELDGLMERFYGFCESAFDLAGIRYTFPERSVFIEHTSDGGEAGKHSLSYNLTFSTTPLGELKFSFNSPASKVVIELAEDLTALLVSPLNNALRYLALKPAPAPAGRDSLIAIHLDNFDTVRERDGDAWAQTLLHAVLSQIRSELRGADTAYQVDDQTLAVLLPHTKRDAAEGVADKLRASIAALQLQEGDLSSGLTACMGIADTSAGTTPEAILQAARAALNSAKNVGLGEIQLAETAVGGSLPS